METQLSQVTCPGGLEASVQRATLTISTTYLRYAYRSTASGSFRNTSCMEEYGPRLSLLCASHGKENRDVLPARLIRAVKAQPLHLVALQRNICDAHCGPVSIGPLSDKAGEAARRAWPF